MAQILDLGKIRFNWAGTYSGGTEYEYNDLVKYGPNLYSYIGTSPASGVVPTNTGSWVLVTEGVQWRGTYTNGTLYYKNDIVTDGLSSFIVKTQHTATSNTPTSPIVEVLAVGQPGLPAQLTNANKVLTTDGSSTSWTATTKLTKTYTGTSEGVTAQTYETNAGLSDVMSIFTGSSASFSQFVIYNDQNASEASTDLIAYTPDGTNDEGWIDLGITSRDFDSATYGITGPHDGYIFMSAPRPFSAAVTTKSVTSGVAELTTLAIHGYSVGDIIHVEGVGIDYDGTRTITATPTTTKIRFASTLVNDSSTILNPYGVVYKPVGDGNLVFATDKTGLSNSIVFAAGGYVSGTTQMQIIPDTTVHIEIATQSTSATTGALVVAGGAGFSGAVSVDGLVRIKGLTYVGEDAELFETNAGLTNAKVAIVVEGGPYAQVAITNPTADASTDVLLYADNGDDTTGWIDLGITGSQFEQQAFGLTGQNDGYVFYEAPEPVVKNVTNKAKASGVATLTSTAHGFEVGNRVVVAISDAAFDGAYTITAKTANTFSYTASAGTVSSTAATGTATKQGAGNLVIATGDKGSDNKIIIAAGGFATGAEQIAITPGVNVHVEIPTPSTSPTTGALTVVGGVGIVGDVNIQGGITFGGAGTQVGTANLAVEEPMIYVGDGSTSTTNDIAFVGEGKYIIPDTYSKIIVNKVLTSNVATLTTKTARGAVDYDWAVGDTIVISGVDAVFNGTYTITALPDLYNVSYARTSTNVASTRVGDDTTTITNKELLINVATLTTSGLHNYLVGEEVVVTGVGAPFNGTWTITAVTSNTFSFALVSTNVTSSAASGTAVVNHSTATAVVTNPIRTRWTAWSKDMADGYWKLSSNLRAKPTTQVDYTQLDIAYDTAKIGGLINVGNSTLSGTLSVTGNVAINTNKFNVTAATGNTAIAGDVAVNTNKFNVTATSGNTAIAGTLAVNTGTISTADTTFNLVNTTATTVNLAGAATSLNMGAATGTATINNANVALSSSSGNFTINTNKFTVATSTGNTNTAGTITALGTVSAPSVTITTTPSVSTDATTVGYVDTFVGNRVNNWQLKSSAYTAVANDHILANTSGGAFTITLPASPAANTRIRVHDVAGTFASANCTLNPGSEKLVGTVDTLLLDINNVSVELIYVNATYGWRIV